MWWHPDPRFVLFPENLRVSKSMRPYFNQEKYTVRYNTRFREVMEHCQQIYREGQNGSWINEELLESFVVLNEAGIAHSVEVYEGEDLIGGLYGMAIGNVFFGESMFHLRPNASKFGFITLVRSLREKGFVMIDCQQETDHLKSLGGENISRVDFLEIVGDIQDHIVEGRISNW